MSYGSTFVQFEANGRISQKFSRPHVPSDKKEHFVPERGPPKVVHYEKEFNVRLTRVDGQVPDRTSVRDSMLAYSRKMKSLQDSRFGGGGGSKGDPLFVRAKHIPKYPTRSPKKRRPMSFDELLGRDRDTLPRERPNGAKPRPHSEKFSKNINAKSNRDLTVKPENSSDLHLPLLRERLKKSTQNVQVSLVSASDLYDIVDFSIRSKGTRSDSLNMLKLEKQHSDNRAASQRASEKQLNYDVVIPEDAYDRFERQNDSKQNNTSDETRNYVESIHENGGSVSGLSEEFYKQVFALDKSDPVPLKTYPPSTVKLPSITSEPIRRRPNRAKRMRLIDPGLGDIPEDNIIETDNSVYKSRREQVRVVSPPPQRSPMRSSESPPSLDVIQENVERVSVQDNQDFIEHEGERNHNDTNLSYSSINSHASPASSHPSNNHSLFPPIDDRSTKKVLKDDGDVRIEVTQCPPKHETGYNAKMKAQKRFKKLIFLRDGPR